MGKKGKKPKITGTPDVQKFKQQREFWLLKECATIQESLPFVAVDPLDEGNYKKVARFLNMVGLLAEHLRVQSTKEYRFNNHHKYLAPTPQFFPFGYDVGVIRAARHIQENPKLAYNGREYPYPEALKMSSEQFLKDVDNYMTKIASEIEPRLKDDFAPGLKRFKIELRDHLVVFDKFWVDYEEQYLKAKHNILEEVYEPIDRLIALELQLSQAEERLDIHGKQQFENELVQAVEDFTHRLFPELSADLFPDDVIPLAEATIFYESKCTDEWLNLAKHLIKDYLELRTFVAKVPEVRLSPSLKENQQLMRVLQDFHSSVLDAKGALDFVARLPRLIDAKTENWMTKKLLDPDLRYIQKTIHLAMEGGAA